MEADDQAIQTILLGLPEDIYAAVDSCETAQEIWLRVQQMMKGSDIGIQEKKAKLFNEWERFTSTDGESIESYYHRFSKLMNDFKRNKHFPEKIASNLKFLNNLQPEWSRHVTIVHQTKDLHTTDYTQLYDFLKYNQKEIAQPGMNMGQDRQMRMVGANGGNQFRQYAGQNVGYQNEYNAVQNVGNQVVQDAVQNQGVQNIGNQNGQIGVQNIGNGNLLIAQKEEAGIQLQAEEFDLMAAAGDLDEIEEVNANCILMANLQQASERSKYTEILEPIPEPHQVQQNDNVISDISASLWKTRAWEVDQTYCNVGETRMFRINPFKPSREEKSRTNNAKTDGQDTMEQYKNDRVPSASKSSCNKNKEVEDMNSRGKKQKANVSNTENQKKQKPKVIKPKKVGSKERLASPKPMNLRVNIELSNGDNACTSNPPEPSSKRFPNPTSFLGSFWELSTLEMIMLLQFWFCDSDLEVAFTRNTYFVRNLKGVDLLKENRTTNFYTINLHEMASASPICLMARATSTKSWLRH
ncbi:hypothetical protein Tco_0217445 [Tanacetum coccineum]